MCCYTPSLDYCREILIDAGLIVLDTNNIKDNLEELMKIYGKDVLVKAVKKFLEEMEYEDMDRESNK